MKNMVRSLQIVFLIVLFSGCSLTTSIPPVSKYLLDVKIKTLGSTQSCFSDKVLRMGQMESPIILSGRSIYYRVDGGQSYRYTKSRWMEAAPQQLTNLMMISVTKTKLFKDVIPFRSLAKNDLILESSLYHFTQTIHSDGMSTLHVAMKVRLVEQYSRKIIASKLFELSKDNVEGDVEGAIAGYSELSTQLLDDINVWLQKSCTP